MFIANPCGCCIYTEVYEYDVVVFAEEPERISGLLNFHLPYAIKFRPEALALEEAPETAVQKEGVLFHDRTMIYAGFDERRARQAVGL